MVSQTHCASLTSLFSFGIVQARGFPDISVGKESACTAGDSSLIPGWGRSAGEGKVYPLQYSCLENSIDSIVNGFAESDTTEQVSLSLEICKHPVESICYVTLGKSLKLLCLSSQLQNKGSTF